MMYWKITRDHFDGSDEPSSGPVLESVKGMHYRAFRMRDDDNILMYSGYAWLTPEEDGGEEMFAPLDNFGKPNAGCTSIQYYNPETRTWDVL